MFLLVQEKISKQLNKIIEWLLPFCFLMYSSSVGIIEGGKRSNCIGLNKGYSENVGRDPKAQTSEYLIRKKMKELVETMWLAYKPLTV